MKSLKKFKSYIGSIVIFSFMLQVTGPLFAATPLRQQDERLKETSNEQNLIVDDNLVACIAAMVHDAAHADVYEQLPEPVKRCYTHISNNAVGLPTDDVMAALPSILRYAFEQAIETTRAVRPDAPDLNDAPIVGPGIGCDLKPVLSLLKLIKNRIGCVSDPVCCDSILGILGDACEKFGPDSNISCKILEICESIVETRTVLCNKFEQTWTILDEICEKIENIDRCPTLTCDLTPVLDAIDECCEEIKDDIFDTQTILCEKIVNIDMDVDLIIEEIIDTRTILCNKFEQTWTILDELQESLDECCDEIIEDIFDTQTILCRKFDDLCFPIALKQEDVVNGQIVLTEKGNYQFCENIDADLVICNTCISVDMNDRKLFGTVCIKGDDIILKNGYIQPEAPVDVADAATPAVEVKDCVVNTRLLNLTITNADSTEVDANNNGLNGRDGIVNNGIKTFILDCCIQTGAGAPGGEADGEQTLSAGTGGNGGCGINSLKDKVQIGRTIIMTGNGGDGGESNVGGVDGGDAGNSGTGIKICGDLSCVFETRVFTGNGGNGGEGCCENGGNGGDSGDGICNKSESTEIRDCTCRTGNAGDGGAGDTDSQAGDGGNSGNAIKTQGTQIIRVVLSTGNAGNGGNAGTGGVGGNAGHGLFVWDACETEAREIVVERTGIGGNGGNSSVAMTDGGAGGNGGDAVNITKDSHHTEVRLSTFSNTGRGGTGGTPGGPGAMVGTDGNPGRAVRDLNTDLCSLDPACTTNQGPSAIFANFAYGIGDTEIRYSINGKEQEAGRSSDKSCNRLDNVYVECNVDVVFDFCQEIVDTRTILCNKFEQTWTVLADIKETLTECCEEIKDDILDTQTILCDKFNQTFTVLEELQESLDDCCEEIKDDIFDTRTILCDKLVDLQDTITSLDLEIDLDLSEILVTLTECCDDIKSDIFGTQTILCDKFDQTFTVLDNICDKIENISVTATATVDFSEVFTVLEELQETLDECCDDIKSDIFDTQTILCQKILDNADCDFFITQNSTGESNNVFFSAGTATLSQPGVYCLAEDVSGTISIESDNVTVKFEGHTLTAASPGITSAGFSHIRIEGGTITGTTSIDSAIDISTGIDIEIISMTLTDNSGIGIDFTTVDDFIIHDCQFTNYRNTCMNFNGSSNGKITCCQMHDNDTVEPPVTLTLIDLSNNCKQLLFDEIVITDNSSINTLTGINVANTDECRFNNILITCNSAIDTFKGIRLVNSEDNTISGCLINKNTIPSSMGIKTFIGIEITADIDDSGHNNMVMNCKVNENTATSSDNLIILVGYNIASTAGTSGTVAADACKNCSLTNCTANNNTCSTNVGNSLLVGINLGSIVAVGTTGTNVCSGCSINSCNVNNNNNSTTSARSFFVGINVGGVLGLATSIVGTNACTSCSIDNCNINNNNSTTNANNLPAHFAGINFGGILNVGTISTNACASCTARNCAINNNSTTSSQDAFFVGVNMSAAISSGIMGVIIDGSSCNSCQLENISIFENTLDASNSGFLYGVFMNGRPGTGVAGGCNNITNIMCLVEGNNVITNGAFIGFLIDGTGVSDDFEAGCNNVTLKMCEVHKNDSRDSTADSDAYRVLGTTVSVGLGGARNIQLENCTAKQNTSAATMDGFDLLDASNAILLECMGLAQTNNGFNLKGVIDSCLRECKAIDNGEDGFIFEDGAEGTRHLTITECQALSNSIDGFEYTGTSIFNYTADSIAQNNTAFGFNNVAASDDNIFARNFAQNNGTDNYNNVTTAAVTNLTTAGTANDNKEPF